MTYLLLLLSLSLVSAHNWIATPSRVPFAATTFPCMNKRSQLPHVQIHPDQEWQTEWAVGHEADVYFVLIREEDDFRLQEHRSNVLDSYISNAPSGANLIGDTKYRKLRRTETLEGRYDQTASSIYRTRVQEGDYQYLDRPDEFGRTNEGGFDGEGFLWDYHFNNEDAVVSYESATYPWIMAVWRYEIEFGHAAEIDTARFWLADPSGARTTGNYILHYLWRGYYDCIDVNVIDHAGIVPFPYGAAPPPGNSSYVSRRVDHCMFTDVEEITGTPREVLGAHGEDVCVTWCIRRAGFGCAGINLYPYNLGRRSFPGGWNNQDNFIIDMTNESFYVERYPYTDYHLGIVYKNTDQDDYDPNNDLSRDDLKALFDARDNEDDFVVCIPVWPRQISTTQDKYIITDDPEDPIFYSTCYEVLPVLYFIGYNATTPAYVPRHDWKHFDRCTTCETREINSRDQVPFWDILPAASTQCRNCDRSPPAQIPPVSPFEAIMDPGRCSDTDNSACGGAACGTKQIEWVQGLGYGRYEGMNEDACAAMVAKDPECSNTFWYTYYGYPNPGRCDCLLDSSPGDGNKDNSCCVCIGTSYDGLEGTLYSLSVSARENPPGFTPHDCEAGVGVRGTDGSQACCTLGCDDCEDRSYNRGSTVCWAYGIPAYRTCDMYNPPCWRV